MESIYNKYNNKFNNYKSLIINQIKLCEYQFYYFQNLKNENKFKKEDFDKLNLLNFKNIIFNLPTNDIEKNYIKYHYFDNFSKFYIRETNIILKDNLIINNKITYQPFIIEQKFYENYKNLNFTENKYVSDLKKSKYIKFLIYYKIGDYDYLNFLKDIYFLKVILKKMKKV